LIQITRFVAGVRDPSKIRGRDGFTPERCGLQMPDGAESKSCSIASTLGWAISRQPNSRALQKSRKEYLEAHRREQNSKGGLDAMPEERQPGARANTRDWGHSVFPESQAACGSAVAFGICTWNSYLPAFDSAVARENLDCRLGSARLLGCRIGHLGGGADRIDERIPEPL